MITQQLVPYIDLISSFVNNSISASDFETQYLTLFKNDTTLFTDEAFAILDELFGDIDSFYDDSSLRDSGDLDAEQLRTKAGLALEKLQTSNR